MAITKASNERPTVRAVLSADGRTTYVVEVRADLMLIREKGRRRGGRGEVAVSVGWVYVSCLRRQIANDQAARKANRKRKRKGA